MKKAIARYLIIISLVLAQIGSAASAQSQQQKEPPVQLSTELIELRAVVTDKQGRIVQNLTKGDFELLENGKPQNIGFFSVEQVGAVGPVPVLGAEKGRRSISFLVDTLNTTTTNLVLAKQALRRFIDEQLSESDQVAIFNSSANSGPLGRFLKDRNLLRHAANSISPSQFFRTSRFSPYLAALITKGEPNAVDLGIEIMKREERIEFQSRAEAERQVQLKALNVLAEASYRRKGLIGVIRAVTARMAGLAGQRILILFSDGFTLLSTGDAEVGDLQAAISDAVRAGVLIYTVDLKGLKPPAISDLSLPLMSVDTRTSALLERFQSASDGDLQSGMNALGKDTGGDAIFNTNDMSGAVKGALAANRVYYTLAYYPPETGGKGFRKIALRVKGNSDYSVRAQRGYLSNSPHKEKDESLTPQQQLVKAMTAPLPTSAIELAAWADHLEVGTDNSQVSLRVHIDGNGLDYAQQNDRYQIELELMAFVFDKAGKLVHSLSEKLTALIRSENLAAGKDGGYDYAKRLALKPGFYEVRVGVREPRTGRIGTAAASVLVPDLGRGKPELSGLLLAEGPQEETKGIAAGKDASAILSGIDAGIKTYKHGSTLIYYLIFYNAKKTEGGELTLQSEIYQDSKPVYRSTWQPLSSRTVGTDRKGVEIGGQIKLDLDSGVYELRISVAAERSKWKETRSVQFGVVPRGGK